MAVDWGPVAAWVGTLLTGPSLLIAASAYRQSVKESFQQQARSVTAWVEDGDQEVGAEADYLCLRNASHGAVQLVVLRYFNSTDELAVGGSLWRSVGPETTIRLPSSLAPGRLLLTTLDFVDSSGTPWRRSITGQLSTPKRRLRRQVRDELQRYFQIVEEGPPEAAV